MVYFIVAKRRRSENILSLPDRCGYPAASKLESSGSDIEAVQTGLIWPIGWQKALQREPNTQVKWQGSNYGCRK